MMTDRAGGAPEDRSVGELFADLTREIVTLVKQEITLAKTELSQKASKVGKDLGFLMGGILFAYIGLLALVAALIILLGQTVMPMWASALLVGIVFAVREKRRRLEGNGN